MIKDFISLLVKRRTTVSPEKYWNTAITELKVHPSGREAYIRARQTLLETLLKPPGLSAMIFEQFSFEDCFLLIACVNGELLLLTERGREIHARFREPFPDDWKIWQERTEELLSHTTRRDDIPLTGFGHAAFFFLQGRDVFTSKKHIPLMEKEKNGFRELHLDLLSLKHALLAGC
ncbi:MAG: hypothetical protein IT233_08125 [Bacteroidia bacterium]|nr:hypothetical protein [Bacteroidia bacterium]